MQKPSENKSRPTKSKKYMLVRYGRMSALGFFEHNENEIPKVHTRVVVKTERGLELGHIVGHLNSYRGGQFKLKEEQVKEYFINSEIDYYPEHAGKFIRYATSADISEERHLKKNAKEEVDFCKKIVREMDLPMKIVEAEHLFGGERIVFYFMSEGRVDFRELVKRIAQEYQTRIEMRQIGSRDEAKLLGDLESCGQQCCCQRFLKLLKPVNMRMAKMQKATLDPAKISGYCGRLKCCLRYEDETYTSLKKKLPKRNSFVKTPKGTGKVIDSQILTQLVLVEYENGDKEAVKIDEIQVLKGIPTPKDNKPNNANEKNNNKSNKTRPNNKGKNGQ
ncbi:MAG: hypothetical protein JXA96_08760 [Sedimentisphaerales bacterium]|nr:hypothetical protein [Sedimentisphaerales bacterium]